MVGYTGPPAGHLTLDRKAARSIDQTRKNGTLGTGRRRARRRMLLLSLERADDRCTPVGGTLGRGTLGRGTLGRGTLG